jgi:hypothetical protein
MGVDVKTLRDAEVERYRARFACSQSYLLGEKVLDGRAPCDGTVRRVGLSLSQQSYEPEGHRCRYADLRI